MVVAQVRDVAALAGVSPGTVSNALNHPEKVTAATRERIQRAIDELGFVRNEAAHRLRRGVRESIGMLVLDVRNPFFTDVARGVELGLAQLGRPLLIGNSDQDPVREQAFLDSFEEQQLSGLLITPVGKDLKRLRRLRDRGTAVVLVDRMSKTSDFSSVAVDDSLGGRLAADHLLEIGRRRIAFIGGPKSIAQVSARLRAARKAVERFGQAQLTFYESAAMDFTAGRDAVEQFLALPRRHRPDAVFAGNDLVAIGALQALTLAGVSVPDDIAIVGYDDIEFAGSAAIPLTSVRQPAVEVGQRAAELLLAEIADPSAARPQHITLKPELVVRQSTG